MESNSFDPDLIHSIFRLVWKRKALEREKNENAHPLECELGAGVTKKSRSTSKAVQRAAAIAEAEGVSKLKATHLERILPQLPLDF